MTEAYKVLSLADISRDIDLSSPAPVTVAHRNESLLTVLYLPRGEDLQEPHDEDEIYVVATGSAVLEVDGSPRSLSQGDAAFVAAGIRHRFTGISDDFAVWAVFPVTESGN